MTNGIKGTAMQLVDGRVKVQQHWEVRTAGLVANTTGSDKAVNFLLEAGALEPMVGKGTM